MQLFIALVFALLLVYIGLLLYYRSGWKALCQFDLGAGEPRVFISVIIPARNEETSLPRLLEGLKLQTYPANNFEVIVVDDHSTDSTPLVASNALPNLKLVMLKDFVRNPINSYKKKAIETGISQSRGELIVTTDADCTVPSTWLHTIAAYYEKTSPAFIVMPVAINSGKSLLGVFQALDFMTLQGITAASVHLQFHTMCNGANLAYTKKAFNAVDGFSGIDTIASGDDMLLMHKIYKRFPDKVAYLSSKAVIVQTNPMYTLRDFFNQRIRWASKADKYEDKRVMTVLVLVYLLNVLLVFIPVYAVFRNSQIQIFLYSFSLIELWLLFMLIKIIFELLFLYPVARFFQNVSLLYVFPLLQPFHLIYTVIAGWLGKFGNYHWKGRTVK